MNDRPYVLIAALFGAVAVAILVAWYFGTSRRGPLPESASTETFRARAGTQREQAKAIVSNREMEKKEGTRVGEVEVWGRYDGEGSESTGDVASESLRLADDVVSDLSTEEGLAVLSAELERSEAPSALYAAMGSLYARSDPFDEQRVEDAFALALATAASSSERLNAISRQAKVYIERGRWDDVLSLLERTQPEVASFEIASAEIELMRANAQWATGKIPSAMVTLESVINLKDLDALLNDPAFESIYRQAAARLVRLYRESDDPDRAEAVSRSVRSKLRE